jgi:heme-degrading monooxygenase HmoA
MPTLPWATPASISNSGSGQPADADAEPPGSEVQVMASRFVLRSRRDTVRMLRHASAVRRALLGSPGALGVSLVARPLRREYWTLSAWSDRASLDAFVAHPVHRAAMAALAPTMAESAFRFWTQPASALPPSWDDAHAAVGGPGVDTS